MAKPLQRIFETLYSAYGAQGWAPLTICTANNSLGFHPGDYSFPHNEQQKFETLIGITLKLPTRYNNHCQKNIEKLLELKDENLLEHKQWLKLEGTPICMSTVPMASKKFQLIKSIASLFDRLNGATPLSEDLQGIKGIGESLASSMLIYGYKDTHYIYHQSIVDLLCEFNLIQPKAAKKKALIIDYIQQNIDHKYEVVSELLPLIQKYKGDLDNIKTTEIRKSLQLYINNAKYVSYTYPLHVLTSISYIYLLAIH